MQYYKTEGVLSKLGRQDQRPYAPLNIVAELGGGGLMCALGISMAIFERNKSGQGQVIDASMTEGAAYLGAWYDANKASFSKPRGLNLLDGGTAYYNTYVTKDFKFVAVGALESGCYENLLKGLNLMDKNLSQSGDQQQQKILFANVFLTKTRDEWAAIFNDLDACVTPVLTGEEAVRYPHNSVKETFQVSSNLPIVIANAAPSLYGLFVKKSGQKKEPKHFRSCRRSKVTGSNFNCPNANCIEFE
ncbi:hypothetical protein Btru_016518 [Bulinus truncatus]|nr:hypothetical protein Btru_016518 [Bulinus truncatus]